MLQNSCNIFYRRMACLAQGQGIQLVSDSALENMNFWSFVINAT